MCVCLYVWCGSTGQNTATVDRNLEPTVWILGMEQIIRLGGKCLNLGTLLLALTQSLNTVDVIAVTLSLVGQHLQ